MSVTHPCQNDTEKSERNDNGNVYDVMTMAIVYDLYGYVISLKFVSFVSSFIFQCLPCTLL